MLSNPATFRPPMPCFQSDRESNPGEQDSKRVEQQVQPISAALRHLSHSASVTKGGAPVQLQGMTGAPFRTIRAKRPERLQASSQPLTIDQSRSKKSVCQPDENETPRRGKHPGRVRRGTVGPDPLERD